MNLNPTGRITKMYIQPLAGDEISKIKQLAKDCAIMFKCKVYFTHNTTDFIVDEEGSIAKTN